MGGGQQRPHAATLPLVGVSTNMRQLPDYKVHSATEKAVLAVYEAAHALPMLLPALGDKYDFASVVDRLDGLLLTGGASHVAPQHYSGVLQLSESELDAARDATTLPLIRLALDAGLPILALCRGLQELNVALGGTLRQVEDKTLHSSDGQGMALEHWLVTRLHPVTVQQDGVLGKLCGVTTANHVLQVNTAHSQAIDRLAPALRIEAVAGDGTIEAVSVKDSAGFALGVQWHPEYLYKTHADAHCLFAAFGSAVRQRMAQRLLQGDWTARLDSEPAVGANLGG